MKKILGVTLFELLLTLSILSIITLNLIQYAAEASEKKLMELFANDISSLLSAVDKRLIIDGLAENNLEFQLDNESFSESIRSAFVSRDSDCSNKDYGWEPKQGGNLILLACDMWRKKIPYNFNIKSKVISENGSVSSVYFIFSIDKKTYDKNNSLIIKLHNNLIKSVNSNIIGTQSYSLIDNDGESVNKMKCIRLADSCLLKAEFKVTPMFILQNNI